MQRIVAVEPGFAVADAAYPELHAKKGVLLATFQDWRGREVKVRFEEVIAFHWQEAESLLHEEAYDGSCELLESEWTADHQRQGLITEGTKVRHLRFNFNACGKLEVLCGRFSVEAG
jgi:hypothetical protein